MQDNLNSSKRQAFSKEDAVELLRQYAVQIFSAFDEALEKYNVEIQQTSPLARVRLLANIAESFSAMWAITIDASL